MGDCELIRFFEMLRLLSVFIVNYDILEYCWKFVDLISWFDKWILDMDGK